MLPDKMFCLKKEMKMRKISVVLLSVIIGIYIIGLSGCTCKSVQSCDEGQLYVYDPNEFFSQYGETAAEGHRRHLRILNLSRQGLMADLDYFFLFDQPSRLTEMRIP